MFRVQQKIVKRFIDWKYNLSSVHTLRPVKMEMKNKRGKFQRGLIKKCEEGDTLVHLLLTHQMITVNKKEHYTYCIFIVLKNFLNLE
jgi:hypothetical protein